MAAKTFRWIRSGALRGARNMALDEAVAAADPPPPTVRVYRWDPWTLSLGWFQRVEEADLAPFRAKGWDVTRRATGGGAILLEANRKILHERGFVVYLRTSIEQQVDRVRQGRNRPLLHNVDPAVKLTELMAIRAPLYESLADFTVATDGRKVHAVADAIYAAFKAAQNPS